MPIKYKSLDNNFIFKKINEAEVEKIACYTRWKRHVVELVPLEHSSLRSSCSKPSRSAIDCLAQPV
jgi:hypothetical protein